MRLIEFECFPRRLGAMAETIPDFAFGILLATEQDVLRLALLRIRHDH